MRRFLRLLCISAATVAVSSIGLAAEPLITFLDGNELEGATVSAINAEGTVLIKGQKETADVDFLRLILTGTEPKPVDASQAMHLQWIDGSQMTATLLSVKGERLTFAGPAVNALTLPIDAIERVRLQPENKAERHQEAFATAPGDLDLLLVQIEGELQKVRGFIVKIDDNSVEYEFEGERATFERKQVYGIILAKPDMEIPYAQAAIHTVDGSVIRGNVATLAADKLVLKTIADTRITIPWAQVTEASLNADRLAFLSDLKPVDYSKAPIVAPNREWAADRSIKGLPIVLNGKQYRKGLGMVSGMTLVFEPASKFDIFSATIGINDGTGNLGDCEYIVIKDRKEIFRKVVKGTDPPEKINLDITNADTVTLKVDYGKDLDLADHADWAEACFIKNLEE